MSRKPVKAFLTKLDELNVIMLESWYTADRKDREALVKDDLFDLLVEAYLLGIDHASDTLEQVVISDPDRMEEAIYRKIDGQTFEDRAVTHVRTGNMAALQTLAESEYHRVFNQGAADGAKEVAKETGRPVYKTWRTMRDDRVRETHFDLEGQTIPQNEYFFANDGDQALYPGGFANPENNVNCRCWLDYRRVNS